MSPELVGLCAGLAGGYTGAYLQPRLPELLLRRLLGLGAVALAVAYVVSTLF